jgi:S-adenosylmethionine decarboxylase
MNKTADMWVNIWYFNITNPDILNKILEEKLKSSGFTIVGEEDYHFSPEGYTKTFLLSESHCALHTWPEINRTWLELASCNQEKLLKFTSEIKNSFDVRPISEIETKYNENI